MDPTDHLGGLACHPEITDETGGQAKAQREQAAAGPGEVAESGTPLPHWFGPAADQPVEILSLFGRQGQRIPVRAAPRRKASNA
jgi:hypothetical protein